MKMIIIVRKWTFTRFSFIIGINTNENNNDNDINIITTNANKYIINYKS